MTCACASSRGFHPFFIFAFFPSSSMTCACASSRVQRPPHHGYPLNTPSFLLLLLLLLLLLPPRPPQVKILHTENLHFCPVAYGDPVRLTRVLFMCISQMYVSQRLCVYVRCAYIYLYIHTYTHYLSPGQL